MMNLVYYQPWSLMDRWHHEIDELFTGRSDASLPLPAVTNSTAWSPSVDLQEESDRFILRADVPGVAAQGHRSLRRRRHVDRSWRTTGEGAR